MYGIDEFWDNIELSEIDEIVSEFSNKCVDILMNNVKSDIGQLIKENEKLNKDNDNYKTLIKELKKEQQNKNENEFKSNLLSTLSDNILKKFKNCSNEKQFLINFCELIFDTEIPIEREDITECPVWLILAVKHYSYKKEIIDILNYFNIKYPDELCNLRLPNEWNESELDIFFKNMPNHYNCNCCNYANNLRFWKSRALYSVEKQCSYSYSEIPWQIILLNPLLKKEKYLKQIGENIFAGRRNWIYFIRILDYQNFTSEEFNYLINSIKLDEVDEDYYEDFYKFFKPYIEKLDYNTQKPIFDKFFSCLCEYNKYYIEHTPILLSLPVDYIKKWFKNTDAKKAFEYLARYDKELINTFGENIKQELCSINLNIN